MKIIEIMYKLKLSFYMSGGGSNSGPFCYAGGSFYHWAMSSTPKPTVLSSEDEPFCGDEGPRVEVKICSEVHG